MLVDLVLMRQGGHKLPKDALERALPVRGRLVMNTHLWADPWHPTASRAMTTLAALLDPEVDGKPSLVPFLVRAHMRQLLGDSMVVIGEEADPNHPGGYLPQAWWCRLVTQHNSVSQG